MVRIGDFLKSLFNPESENYKLGLISCSSLILLFSLLFSKFHKFFIIILVLYFIFLPVILYRNRMDIMEKEAAVFIFILLFQLTIITGHPLFLIFLVVSILTFCNIFAQKKERIIQTQAIIMIALTLIILEVSYPIFEPRVEVEYVGEMYKGYIFNEITYGYQDFTLSIVPPLLPFSCREIILGYDVLGHSSEEYHYGVRVDYNEDKGSTSFCTPFTDFTKRIIKLTIISRQPLRYNIYGKNITRFYWLTDKNNLTRKSETRFDNHEDIPLIFAGSVSYLIKKDSMLDRNLNLWEFLNSEKEKIECRLSNFRFSRTKDIEGGVTGSYKIEDDKINLTFDLSENWVYVPPYNYTIRYIQFDPYACD